MTGWSSAFFFFFPARSPCLLLSPVMALRSNWPSSNRATFTTLRIFVLHLSRFYTRTRAFPCVHLMCGQPKECKGQRAHAYTRTGEQASGALGTGISFSSFLFAYFCERFILFSATSLCECKCECKCECENEWVVGE